VNITIKQWFQIVSSSVAGLITGAALLNPLFGQALSLKIVAGLGIVNIIVGSVGTALSGQKDTVQEVLDMKGVERIRVNKDANATLAALAMDPTVDKISPTDEARTVVAATAKAA
jgi:hypothetical protein